MLISHGPFSSSSGSDDKNLFLVACKVFFHKLGRCLFALLFVTNLTVVKTFFKSVASIHFSSIKRNHFNVSKSFSFVLKTNFLKISQTGSVGESRLKAPTTTMTTSLMSGAST